MAKTNHQRSYKENLGTRTEYGVIFLGVAPDGAVIQSAATGPSVDHCCGKHGAARDRAGAKKFIHSRIRRRTREWLKEELAKVDDE